MGFFNFIETFFFISLAITFVLILLLVYHFKQRIISLEQKSETVVQIINNIVKEINNIRNIVFMSQPLDKNMSNITYSIREHDGYNNYVENIEQHNNIDFNKRTEDDYEVVDYEEDDEDEEDDEEDDEDEEEIGRAHV